MAMLNTESISLAQKKQFWKDQKEEKFKNM